MEKHLVLVGTGHAHLTTLANLRELLDLGAKVSVISPSKHHYYSGMGPGMLSGMFLPREARFKVKKMSETQGARFILDKAVNVNPHENQIILESGKVIEYDLASFNVGSKISGKGLANEEENVIPVKPVENLYHAREKILIMSEKKELSFAIIGGGAAGTEITGNLHAFLKETDVNGAISLISDEPLLSKYPKTVRKYAKDSLQERGVRIMEDVKVSSVGETKLQLEDGTSMRYDLIFLATGVRPSPLFKESGMEVGESISESGALCVNSCLQSMKYPNIFGGGDCIHFVPRPLDKVGVYAVRENPVIFKNLP